MREPFQRPRRVPGFWTVSRCPIHARRAVRGLLPLALLVQACSSKCDGDVHTVEIVPPVTHIRQEHQVRLEAVARNKKGERMYFTEPVTWTLPTGVSKVQQVDHHITLKAGAIPTGVKTHEVTGIRATIAGKKSASATLIVNGDGPAQDELVIADAVDPSAAILDAGKAGGSDCVVNDSVLAIVSRAVLAEGLTQSNCIPETALFSVAHAGHVMKPTAWSTSPDDWTFPSPGRITVPLIHYWAASSSPPSSTDVQDVRSRVGNVNKVFERNRVGIVLNVPLPASIMFHGGPLVADALKDDDDDGIWDICETIAASINEFDPLKADLYVVYLSSIASADGFACPPRPPGRHAGIIGVLPTAHSTTLAHEFGHMLGLSNSTDFSGHVVKGSHLVTGFDYVNLMWVDYGRDNPFFRRTLSLGQVYRMVMDNSSWLHQSGLTTIPVGKSCPGDPCSNMICPALGTEFGGVRKTPEGDICPT